LIGKKVSRERLSAGERGGKKRKRGPCVVGGGEKPYILSGKVFRGWEVSAEATGE